MTSLIQVRNLVKYYPLRRSFFSGLFGGQKMGYVKAVDDVSFHVDEREIFGIVGESGCGKTTTGKLTIRLLESTSGSVYYKDRDIMTLNKKDMNRLRAEIQIVFQNPYESLNPRSLIRDIIAEPLAVQGYCGDLEEEIAKSLEVVGLTPIEDFLYRYPHELSGGQRQRVAIARALVLKPRFVVADEPVSMLDMSMRGGILNLMIDLKDKFNLSYLFITHDLSMAKCVCDRLAVMYLGKIVEMGATVDMIDEPIHPYVKALIEAIPDSNPRIKIGEISIRGDVPAASDIPTGCRFHPRCLYAKAPCREKEPALREVAKGRYVACHPQ